MHEMNLQTLTSLLAISSTLKWYEAQKNFGKSQCEQMEQTETHDQPCQSGSGDESEMSLQERNIGREQFCIAVLVLCAVYVLATQGAQMQVVVLHSTHLTQQKLFYKQTSGHFPSRFCPWLGADPRLGFHTLSVVLQVILQSCLMVS